MPGPLLRIEPPPLDELTSFVPWRAKSTAQPKNYGIIPTIRKIGIAITVLACDRSKSVRTAGFLWSAYFSGPGQNQRFCPPKSGLPSYLLFVVLAHNICRGVCYFQNLAIPCLIYTLRFSLKRGVSITSICRCGSYSIESCRVDTPFFYGLSMVQAWIRTTRASAMQRRH